MKRFGMEPNESNRNLRKRSPLDYNEIEQDLMYDYCFIKVSGLVYQEWKRLRDTLCMHEDEELVVHLLNAYQQQ